MVLAISMWTIVASVEITAASKPSLRSHHNTTVAKIKLYTCQATCIDRRIHNELRVSSQKKSGVPTVGAISRDHARVVRKLYLSCLFGFPSFPNFV